MTKRAIQLGDGSKTSLRQYVHAWRTILTLDPNTWLNRCPNGWGGTAADALGQLRQGMHDRINRHLPNYGIGRKWSADWQRATIQAAHALNTPRLAIHWLPAHLKCRFEHRLAQND